MNRKFQGELFDKLYIRNSIALHTYTGQLTLQVQSKADLHQKLVYPLGTH